MDEKIFNSFFLCDKDIDRIINQKRMIYGAFD